MAKKKPQPKTIKSEPEIIRKEIYERMLSENQVIFDLQKREGELRKTYLLLAVTRLYLVIGTGLIAVALFYDYFINLFNGQPIRLALFLAGISLITLAYIYTVQARIRRYKLEQKSNHFP